jgi:putative membrane protein
MLWIKSLHIVFIASWFAMLFYLPRIFVNLAQVPQDSLAERQRLLDMAKRLLRFGNILSDIAIVLGVWLWLGYDIGAGQLWFYLKLALVVLAWIYHRYCIVLLRHFEENKNKRSHVWYRIYNEVAVLLFTLIVILVVVKPSF